MKWSLVAFLALTTTAFAQNDQRTAPVSHKQVVIMGDSFAAGEDYYPHYAGLLTPLGVLAKGVSGQRCPSIEARLQSDALTYVPTTLVINCGINDIASSSSDPNATMRAAVQTMIDKALAAGVKRVIVLTTAPFKGSAYWSTTRQTWQDTWNAWILARDNGTTIRAVDIYTPMVDPRVPNTYLALYNGGDSLHPTVAGHTLIARLIVPLFLPN